MAPAQRLRAARGWELAPIAADAAAMFGPTAAIRAIVAAQRRAIDFVSETRNDWRTETRKLLADAWLVLWRSQR